MTDKPVTVIINHPSCTGCKHEFTPDYSHCLGCFYHKAPMEHQNYTPRKAGK